MNSFSQELDHISIKKYNGIMKTFAVIFEKSFKNTSTTLGFLHHGRKLDRSNQTTELNKNTSNFHYIFIDSQIVSSVKNSSNPILLGFGFCDAHGFNQEMFASHLHS